ncbi:hypothetical protein [Leptospira sp. GIMC2001]|uniref:hypothetical protein n=1 Tax=Leptospira sp. GIMC2001 TaxID=1513297 RepID=UPI00234BF6F4|nr:hypothetical protein [Leptospira sp. GIMC2001]WCL50984.1 hypothetical protein O4O04_09275 [Leptospira sp. GIMC2001]
MNRQLIICSVLIMLCLGNCYVGTARDACRYEVNFNKPEVCNGDFFTIFALPPRDGDYQRRTQDATSLLFFCYLYYEDLKNCDDDNNRYKPGLYGLNIFNNRIENYHNLINAFQRKKNIRFFKQKTTEIVS